MAQQEGSRNSWMQLMMLKIIWSLPQMERQWFGSYQREALVKRNGVSWKGSFDLGGCDWRNKWKCIWKLSEILGRGNGQSEMLQCRNVSYDCREKHDVTQIEFHNESKLWPIFINTSFLKCGREKCQTPVNRLCSKYQRKCPCFITDTDEGKCNAEIIRHINFEPNAEGHSKTKVASQSWRKEMSWNK